MICPLSTRPLVFESGEDPQVNNQCHMSDCAWWDWNYGRCFVTTLHDRLESLEEKIEKFSNRPLGIV